MASSDSDSSSSSSDASKRGIKRKREDITAADPVAIGKKEKVAEPDSSASSDESSPDDKGKDDDDVQVLSHAAQRKLKRKAGKAAAKGDVPETREVADPKRQNSVWVGNLTFKTTEQAIRGFFERRVPGCEITRVNMPTKTGKDVVGRAKGENRGFAYVDFSTKEAKVLAIALSEQNLDGRKLLIKDGDDFTGRPTASIVATNGGTTGMSKTAQKILAAQKQPPAPTLFLGNLGFNTTVDSIRSMLEGHMTPRSNTLSKSKGVELDKEDTEDKSKIGTESQAAGPQKWIRKIRMGTFEDSGNCKGWAFVDFYNVEDATAVLINPRSHTLAGRKLVVEYASAEAVRRGGGPGAKSQRIDAKESMPGDTKNGRIRRNREHKDTTIRDAPENDTERRHHEDKDTSIRDAPENDTTENEVPIAKKARTHMKDSERRGNARRAKPGAALALAQREKVAIVPSSGKKIKF